jgi:putative tryptophan/tyrosine transport system substrate-binding protein
MIRSGIDCMKRREFITLLGGAAAAWPLGASAQQSATPVIGFLHGGSEQPNSDLVRAFRQSLKESGFVESRNVAIDFRWADGQFDRLPAMANELVRRQVAVMIAGGGPVVVEAAKRATTTIPIVFNVGSDPVQWGLVASLNRPGGNMTGVYQLSGALMAKRIELVRSLIPTATSIILLVNPTNPTTESNTAEMRSAARSLALEVDVLDASTEQELNTVFATLAPRRGAALVVSPDPFFISRRDQIVALAARSAMPAIYEWREFAVAGGLISYGSSNTDEYRQVGIYTSRILKGEKPGDLPVMQPTKFELVVNLKTAKALGLTIPESFLLRADEVLE